MTRIRKIAISLVAMLALAACGSAESTANIVAPTAAGGQIDFASLEGADTVLWFWAPW